MQKFYALYVFISLFFVASTSDAKIWNLPDYQGQQFLSKRANNIDDSFAAGQEGVKFKCSNYGLVSLASIGADYECMDTFSAPEGCCGTWRCKSSKYSQSDLSCRSLGMIPDENTECTSSDGTKAYRKCKCDTSTYPHTSSCIPEVSGASCVDDYGTHFASPCYDDWCNYLDDTPCGDYRCKKTYDNCDSKCEECYTDTCDYPENDIYPYKSECNSGRCDSRGHIEGCSERCYACDACDMRDCASEGYLAECPANTICNDTCIPNSCNSMVYVKPTGCVTSPTKYYSPKTHWCGINYCKQ